VDRDDGFYWVKMPGSNIHRGEWWVARYSKGLWNVAGYSNDIRDENYFSEIGPMIEYDGDVVTVFEEDISDVCGF